MRLRRGATAVAVSTLLALTGCHSQTTGAKQTGDEPTGGEQAGASPTTTVRSQPCRLSSALVPSCGVVWGIATQPQTLDALSTVEQQVDRPFDLVYDYHDLDDVIPSDTELQEARDGHILHIAIAARVYGATPDSVTYADIATGRYDAGLERQALGIASMKEPVFMTFEQEANQHSKLGPRGTALDFRLAWRHIHNLYADAGADNAVWVWVMTGDPANLSRAGALWPGNAFVDWISWNVYNQSGCEAGRISSSLFTSFETDMTPFYNWVHTRGAAIGIDPTKPMMISEAGSVLYADDPASTARWYAGIAPALSRYPQIKAVALWDSKTSDTCDYRFQADSAVLAAVADIGSSSVVTITR